MKYWSPSEPNTLRFPKPQGVESFEVPDDFIVESAKIIEINGERFLTIDQIKLDQIESKKAVKLADKQQKLLDRKAAFDSIDSIKNLEDVKEILKHLAGLK